MMTPSSPTLLNFQQKIILIFLGLFCFLLPLISQANLGQDPQELRQSIEVFLQNKFKVRPDEELKISVGYLDSRLKLTHCQSELMPFVPQGVPDSEISAVGVRCNDAKPWTIYVPVNIKVLGVVLVSTRNIVKGETIQETDLELAKRNRSQLLYSAFKDKELVVGQVANQNITLGTTFTQRMVEMPTVISKGQQVAIFTRANRVYVEVKGIAQENGYVNKVIPVMNLSSKKVMQGRVTGPGKVEIS
jgi:flagellar basal body P-ring formation protein FlgA